MTRVDFYVASGAGQLARLEVAARLSDKARRRGHRLFIHASSEDEAIALDEVLWSFRPTSFVPHSLAADDASAEVVIGWASEPTDHNDVLINLALAPPPFFSRFQRVAEIVTQENQGLEALRNSWRFYKDRGYPLQKHDL